MSDQIMTAAANLSVIIPQVWSARYFDVLLANLAFAPVISRDWEGEIQDLGDRVLISQFPEFAQGEELAEDERADAVAVTVTQQSLIINKRVVRDFIVTKLAMLQSLPHMDKLRELAIYAVMKKIDNTIIATIVPSASSPDMTGGYTSGTTLALADILNAKKALDAQNVPAGDRSMILDTPQTNDLFNITGFMSSDFVTANSPLSSGQAPTSLLGFSPRMTTLASAVSYFFHKSFMTLASQQGLNVNVYDLGVDGKRAARVNIDTLYGLKQLDSKRVYTLS